MVATTTLPTSERAIAGFNRVTTDKLLEWDKKAVRLFAKLDHDDTKACIAAGLLEELESVPDIAPWEGELTSKAFRTTIATSNPAQAGELKAAAARYQATVASIKKYYVDLVKQYAPRDV